MLYKKRSARELSIEELQDLAERFASGEASLMQLVDTALFGKKKPRRWGQWPEHAKESWETAVHLYWNILIEKGEATRQETKRRAITRKIKVEEAWKAIIASQTEYNNKYRLTWSSLGMHLNISHRAAKYQLVSRLGFRLSGVVPNRKVDEGPCIICRKVYGIEKLIGFHCKDCLNDPAVFF